MDNSRHDVGACGEKPGECNVVGCPDVFGTDGNEAILVGRLATAPEHRTFGSGASLARLLVTVRLTAPSRTDVIPVTVWEPGVGLTTATRGTPVKVEGQMHRRFWTDAEGRHSRVELVAHTVELGETPATVAAADTT